VVVELVDGAEQAQIPLLDQVGQRQAAAQVTPRDADHQAQVGLDHAPPSVLAAGDKSRRHTLLLGRHLAGG
jgi:hypothetical protein